MGCCGCGTKWKAKLLFIVLACNHCDLLPIHSIINELITVTSIDESANRK